jgi:hypothetical protein
MCVRCLLALLHLQVHVSAEATAVGLQLQSLRTFPGPPCHASIRALAGPAAAGSACGHHPAAAAAAAPAAGDRRKMQQDLAE